MRPILLALACSGAIGLGLGMAYLIRPPGPLTPPPKRIAFGGAALLAKARASRTGKRPYTLVEFGDYQCPPCVAQVPAVKRTLRRYAERLGFTFRELPLVRIHPSALPAALVAESASSDAAFWTLHDRLYDLRGRLDPATLARLRGTVLTGTKAAARVADDVALARRVGVRHTPTFFLCLPDGSAYELGSLKQVSELVR